MFLGEESDTWVDRGKIQGKPNNLRLIKQETAQKMIGTHQKIQEFA